MILVADSGSSVTQWACVKSGMQTTFYSTEGLNPLFLDESFLAPVIEKVLMWCGDIPDSVYFYGAGCLSPKVSDVLGKAFSRWFPKAKIKIESDMLGACRALLGEDAGLVGILGTGSNVCRYDGVNIISKSKATGYILGDEGSGNYIGKLLVKSFLDETMPTDLAELFKMKYVHSVEELYSSIYTKPFVNRYLASFVPFAVENESNPFIASLLSKVFDDFFRMQVKHVATDENCISLIGGVAMQFSVMIACAAQRAGFEVQNIMQEPIRSLVAYHQVM